MRVVAVPAHDVRRIVVTDERCPECNRQLVLVVLFKVTVVELPDPNRLHKGFRGKGKRKKAKSLRGSNGEITLSLDADAKSLPSRENATYQTSSSWSSSVCTQC